MGATADGTGPGEVTAGAAMDATFQREGEYWTIEFERQSFRFDSKGMRYLARLLAAPGQEVHALILPASMARRLCRQRRLARRSR